MKRLILLSALSFGLSLLSFGCTSAKAKDSEETVKVEEQQKTGETKIQVAILLDTSSSMDGLINQAKSRLWTIVNTLTTLKYEGKTPKIEIALYEYGNNGLSEADEYIRQVAPLSTDLDLISEKLFALTTNGGYEYCGAVIDKATRQLEWGNNKADMKLVYIAGNEPFTQGEILYSKAIQNALSKNIYVNTIHCGDRSWGINGDWKKAADLGKGKFFNIDHNAKIRHIDTPYDARITECNNRLNSTYIGYGRLASRNKANQVAQDKNAQALSSAVYAERAVSKSKAVYDNSTWDMVDQAKKDRSFVSKLKADDLPQELKGKSQEEIQKYIDDKAKERTEIQKEIAKLAQQRQDYIDEKMKSDSVEDDLGNAITSSVLAFAKAQGYSVE